jgi:3-oxoacyl-[acyl-carrier-protein] synthase-1
MVEASRIALAEAGLGIADIDFRLSDASGEGYGFKEVSLALSRMLRTRKETVPLWLSAETLGEIGAASGIASLVVASVAMGRGVAPGQRAICYTAAPSGDRAVAVLGVNTH